MRNLKLGGRYHSLSMISFPIFVERSEVLKLHLYSVNTQYVNYLRKYDCKVYENKENLTTHTRKYLGIVLRINELNYFIPMSSPKKSDYINYESKLIRKDTKTIIRIHINNHLYGTLRISNMIPVPHEELKPYNTANEKDLKYREVILGELRFIQKNTEKIIKCAQIVYFQKMKELDVAYIKNTVDFKVLEEKSKLWKKAK